MRAFILGNSGELLDHDLGLLQGEVVFGSNAIALRCPEIITNYVCADIIMSFLPEMRRMISHSAKRHYSRLVWNTIDHEDNVEPFDTIDGQTGFNFSTSDVYLCNTVAYASLQIAACLNYNPIYLLGVDLGTPSNGIHHIPEQYVMNEVLRMKNLRNTNADKRVAVSSYDETANKINMDFIYARDILKAEGIEVFNLSTGGNLKAFPRKVYKEVVSNHSNHETCVSQDVELSDN